MNRTRFVTVVCVVSLVLLAASPFSIAHAANPLGTHVVQPGETLYCLGRGYGVLPSAIASANGLSASAYLRVGQALSIPDAEWTRIPSGPVCAPQFVSPYSNATVVTPAPVTNATPTSAGAFYVVQRGDTLWRIHLRFGVTVYALKVANGLRSNLIYVGQVLVIPDGTPPTTTGDTEVLAQVVNVVDGDTIDVNWDGATYRVRYIGVNTPERNEPCFAEATSANATLVSGQTVKLVKDISETDRFGRLLRYVYAGDRFVNAELVAQGYAEAIAYPPDTTHANYFESLEAQARAANLACYTTGVFGDTIGPSPTQAPANCDPAYPTVCIPSPPPDLNCPDVGYTDFTVLAPDPHNFDGDGDGIGCET